MAITIGRNWPAWSFDSPQQLLREHHLLGKVHLESKIPEKAAVRYVNRAWKTLSFGRRKCHRGLQPQDFAVKQQ